MSPENLHAELGAPEIEPSEGMAFTFVEFSHAPVMACARGMGRGFARSESHDDGLTEGRPQLNTRVTFRVAPPINAPDAR
jgi:hypothetical protein